MLQPKRTKFRKQHKMRNRGLAQSGNKVSFGEFGLKALDPIAVVVPLYTDFCVIKSPFIILPL